MRGCYLAPYRSPRWTGLSACENSGQLVEDRRKRCVYKATATETSLGIWLELAVVLAPSGRMFSSERRRRSEAQTVSTF